MAPKRKQPAASAPRAPTKRRSKLAKENEISAEEEAEIQEAFDLFAEQDSDRDSKDPVIKTENVRRCLVALNAPAKDQAEWHELLETIDPDGVGVVSYEHFVAVAALKMHARDDDPDAINEEVAKAYNLFTKGEDRAITLADLKRIAKDLREDVPDNVLKDMIREATGGGLGGVGFDDFESVMRRAGVFT
ncbi:related to EF-hand superfamily Ca2+-modulated protein [Ramularia collo-cygni]|uniref:Calmodulin n=1 Tax=Ramularia collo-cygni TaxID=112498 RepID=A0A2D3VDS8_9PEZI|nr:related to EF-hand superfamily Ca2+-modulated protein [Ramularia collo-cygni]CZT18743.1 related to EF-hand superfamily Ca2+-modulated protein [Ramularia collo-cygni]